jgi:hypothetical protein
VLLLTLKLVQAVSKDIPGIIKAAAESPLGIFALMLLLVAGLAYVFFRRQGPRVTLPVLAAFLVGAACYGWAVTRVPNKPTFRRILLHILEADTNAAIVQAKVQLDWVSNSQTDFSDSLGGYILTIGDSETPRSEVIKLSVQAHGYQTYTQTLDPLGPIPQEIHMYKKGDNRNQGIATPVSSQPALAGGRLSPISCDVKSSLRSGDLLGNTTVRFENRTSTLAQGYWIDPDGKEQFYFELPSNTAYVQPTYAGHPWIIKDVAGHCLGIFLATSKPSVAEIAAVLN